MAFAAITPIRGHETAATLKRRDERRRVRAFRGHATVAIHMIKPEKQKKLERGGWKVGDAADFLEMSDEERQLLDARVELALAIRRQRTSSKLTQKQLGEKLHTSQPRVAKIERAAAEFHSTNWFGLSLRRGARWKCSHCPQRRAGKGRNERDKNWF